MESKMPWYDRPSGHAIWRLLDIIVRPFGLNIGVLEDYNDGKPSGNYRFTLSRGHRIIWPKGYDI